MKYPNTTSLSEGEREKGIVSAVNFLSTDYDKLRITILETIREI